MSREDLERFLSADRRQVVNDLFAETDSDDDAFDVGEALDRHLYAAMSHYDPDASLGRWLSLRFTGERAQGQIDEQAVEDILGALRREITGAVQTRNANRLRLSLVGFSKGSAILHLAPSETLNSSDSPIGQESLGVDPHEDELDTALAVVTDLHRAAEDQADVERFTGREPLLRAFATLTEALEKHELDMGITWRGSTGRHSTAVLTARGREYARRYLERADTSEIITIIGRVVELNITGSFDMKTGTASNSPRYKVNTSGEESLLSLGLELGQTIQVRVRKLTERNKFDVTFSTRYEYLGMVPLDTPLPLSGNFMEDVLRMHGISIEGSMRSPDVDSAKDDEKE